jgi:hypothetical protein
VPLLKGENQEVVGANIRELMYSGYPQKQAVAIAFTKAGLSRKGKTMARKHGKKTYNKAKRVWKKAQKRYHKAKARWTKAKRKHHGRR